MSNPAKGKKRQTAGDAPEGDGPELVQSGSANGGSKASQQVQKKARLDDGGESGKGKGKGKGKDPGDPGTGSGPGSPSGPMGYRLFVTLDGSRDPTITRTLLVPADFTFQQLYHVLQEAFEWEKMHMFGFTLAPPRPATKKKKRSRSDDSDDQPAGIRLVDSPDLHMKFDFDGGQRYVRTQNVKLFTLFDKPEYKNLRLEYDYDSVSSHTIDILEKVSMSSDSNAECIEATGRHRDHAGHPPRTTPSSLAAYH